MDTIFTVKNEDLARLSPVEAVDFFRELLWAEATSLGIGKNLINVPSAITVADGGIDAEIQNVQMSGGLGIIKEGSTRYQIKTGDFSISKDSYIKSILFRDNSNELKPKVKSCLDIDGTLVIVLFGWDNPEIKDNQLINKFKEKLATIDQKYNNAKIEIWRQNNLIGFLKQFPSLTLRVNEHDRARFQTHQSWSQEDDMRKEFKAGEIQKDLISRLQTELRRKDEAVHVRVWGEAGIGKTKLVLEATGVEDLLSLVIYCDSANKFRDSDLMNEILKDDNQFYVILVIDECDPDSRSYIWNKLKHRGPRIKLISIYNEYDDTGGNITYCDPPPLGEEQISGIIQEYSIPKDQADRWSEICSGSPRVAHVIGRNLKNNPEDLLRSPDTVNVWDRYIVGGDDPNSQQVQQRRLVLRHIALFKRFGYGRPVFAEAQAIAKIVEQADSQLTWARFQEIVQNLKARKILQGEYTLYITPKALHIKLWVDWWNTYGNGFHLDEFSNNLSAILLEWFYEMFKYASESEIASQIVKELFGKDGPFQDNYYLKTRLGAHFFLALTEAEPKSALECLKETIGTWTKKELLEFKTGRREVVQALEMIAIWKELFSDAASLLLMLGEAENETYANNASGVFVELFSPGFGQVAPTEASLQERFPILKEALGSISQERRALALQACDQALESEHFVRMIGFSQQGLRKEPQLWMPTTYGELYDSYRRVWKLLYEELDSLSEDERQQVVNILLKRARGLGRIPNLADMFIDTISELVQKSYVDKKKVLAEVSRILHYDGKLLPQQIRQRWEQLRNDMIGSDFSSLMKRYVGMDLLEDKFDEHGKYVDQTLPEIEKLAQQAVDNNDLLQPELEWLVTTDAQNGYRFGYELGKKDKDFSLLTELLEVQQNTTVNASAYFLGGYYRALFERDQQRWEKQLDALAEDKKLSFWVPELTWRSGISDQAVLRILALAEKRIIGVEHFRMFCFGGVVSNSSEDVFKKWIEFLLSHSDVSAVSIALDLYNFYYIRKESKYILPEELTLRLLTHYSLFQRSEIGRRDQMDDYHWAEIGKAFIRFYPKRSLELADKMLEHFGEEGTILYSFYSQTQAVLNEITRQYPQELWKRIIKYLGPPIDSRAFYIRQWLRSMDVFNKEKEGALSIIPPEEIWKWVDEDIEKRAWYLASFVPKTLYPEEGRACLAREVLVRYGQREDVRNNLMANFSTEGWSGPASLHYHETKQKLLDFNKVEHNENVKRWIDEYIAILDEQIKQARIEEERRGF